MTTHVGIVGAGALAGKNCVSLLEDRLNAHKETDPVFVLAVTPAWGETMDAIYEWILDNEYDFTVVYDQAASKKKALKGIIDSAEEATQVTRVPRKVVQDVDAAGGWIALLWDEDNEEPGDPAYDALVVADDKGVKAYDLSDGLDRISFVEVDEDEEEIDALVEAAQAKQEEDKPDTERKPVGKKKSDPEPEEETEEVSPEESLAEWSLKELLAMSRKELKAVAAEHEVDIPARAHSRTYAETLAEYFIAQAKNELESKDDEIVDDLVDDDEDDLSDAEEDAPKGDSTDDAPSAEKGAESLAEMERMLKLEFEGLFASFRDEVIAKIDEIRVQMKADSKKNNEWFEEILDVVTEDPA